jgi:dethiobiotin synthetase
MNIFITGTGTDVGKTFVTAGIAAVMQGLGYKTSIYKPVQTGCIEEEHALIAPDLKFAQLMDSNINIKSTYNFINPVAPSLAAMLENVRINKNDILMDYRDLCKKSDFVLVEGAGGILTPVCQNFLIRDMIKFLNLPVLIVARPDLGTINHTLMTIEAARNFGIDIIGVVISDYPENTDDISIKTAPSIITEISGINVLGVLPHINANISDSNFPELLIEEVLSTINIQEIFKINIPKLSYK